MVPKQAVLASLPVLSLAFEKFNSVANEIKLLVCSPPLFLFLSPQVGVSGSHGRRLKSSRLFLHQLG